MATLTAAAVAGSAHADLPGADPQLTRAPYLSDLTTSSVRVNWGTSTRSTGIVRYGPLGNCTANSVSATAQGTTITVNGVTEYQNTVTVAGLSANTTYCYRVFTGGTDPVDLLGSNPSPAFTTRQGPTGTQPFTFAVIGDWGDTTNGGVNNGSLNVNQANVMAGLGASGARFALSTGDVAYPSGNQTNYGDLDQTGVNISAVFGPSYWAVPGQSVPMYATNGNHGRNSTLLTNWPETRTAAASNGVYAMTSYPSILGTNPASYPSTYYAFSNGGVRFYVLDASWSDSNLGSSTGDRCPVPNRSCQQYELDRLAHWTPSSAEYQWLQQDLATHSEQVKIAAFHYPLRSDDPTEPDDVYLKNTPGSTDSLEQLLHDNGVDLVFNGHAHIYQRNVAPPGGVPAYVTGGGGGKLTSVGGRGCAPTDAYALGWSYSSTTHGKACGAAPRPTSDSQVHHFLKVAVNGTTVTVSPTDAQGNVFDQQVYDFAADTTDPTAPGSFTVTRSGTSTMVLSWSGASDNRGVAAYDVYRDGSYLATVPAGQLTYSDKQATCPGSYQYEVRARDLAGNTAGVTRTVSC
ncbi:fibronectin type III domain-containing protein [Streptomyces sp. T028]|uniref:fibronectin type III domain-containing protein n=1 Tax=Streptomyces sp. T028 TaxID=3394379 RepID=UPI003A8567B9